MHNRMCASQQLAGENQSKVGDMPLSASSQLASRTAARRNFEKNCHGMDWHEVANRVELQSFANVVVEKQPSWGSFNSWLSLLHEGHSCFLLWCS